MNFFIREQLVEVMLHSNSELVFYPHLGPIFMLRVCLRKLAGDFLNFIILASDDPLLIDNSYNPILQLPMIFFLL